MRVAAIDCGTNTMRLLVAALDADGSLRELDRRLTFVGLGEGVDATGHFAPDALQRALRACEQYAEIIADLDCARARFVATSATRDAINRDELFDGVRARMGIEPEVISGVEESELSFAGAVSGIRCPKNPVLVMDSGGGSTELVRGTAGCCTDSATAVTKGVSLDIGSRRLRERILHGDPPTEAEIDQARAFVRQELDGAGLHLADVGSFIGVAGTVTSMTALALRLHRYDRARVHGAAMSARTVHEITNRLLTSTVAEVTCWGPVQPQRAEVLCAGALIVDEVVQRVGAAELIASEADVLDGVALGLFAGGSGQEPARR
ncbi:Ppx/GppA phosphatase family protein [Propionibacterium australiense]|uniref:Ppx/GppA family phosphatase n=1 Tax=Propionibacterium australiense TaxID=119981 RepID=A0A383SAD5_9ACTN|nr:Ppx/GppA phosphatase family protein [Propionibacterium australiense]RLP09540.1 Ppx/GppA family phosphatase [Propionibacterium australiense]RLP09882.1 Ppx/GppA family phosphatase [Propionibacterium australiense]SYZ34186.1 Ppx/GppA phosphatase family [Propionibacterium australiense]VEH89431.1 Guanosine-5'-triphosphate,3'-diphosphate pyrophosphatase [Propionibacterium australiense]